VPRLEGKVALISGAARGQGASHARHFVAEGARVVLGDVLDDLGAEVAAELGNAAAYVHLDVSDENDWRKAVDTATSTFGQLNVLVNNAGILRTAPLADTTVEDYMTVVTVNQVGCFLVMRSVIGAMKAAGGGSIINTSSVAGLQGVQGVIAYVASKYAIRGMTKAAAMELGHSGIRVNAVYPGSIDTPMVSGEEFAGVDQDALYAALPIPRIGQPEDVSHLMVFLASDEAAYCAGGEYTVDGGLMCGPMMDGIID
jgi:3alpha(or 20beta)-hydroxysteroid dehydrogenase